MHGGGEEALIVFYVHCLENVNLSLFLVKPNKCHIIIIFGAADAWLLFFKSYCNFLCLCISANSCTFPRSY